MCYYSSDIINMINHFSFWEKENNIVIFPENAKMTTAIDKYILKTNFYIEYLHWNNNGALDGLVNHDNNMYLLNEKYITTHGNQCVTNYLIYTKLTISFGQINHTQVSQCLYSINNADGFLKAVVMSIYMTNAWWFLSKSASTLQYRKTPQWYCQYWYL